MGKEEIILSDLPHNCSKISVIIFQDNAQLAYSFIMLLLIFFKNPKYRKTQDWQLLFYKLLYVSQSYDGECKILTTFKETTKAFKEISSLHGKLFWASDSLELHSPLGLGLLWWKFLSRTALFVWFCFAFQAKREFRRILKLQKTLYQPESSTLDILLT